MKSNSTINNILVIFFTSGGLRLPCNCSIVANATAASSRLQLQPRGERNCSIANLLPPLHSLSIPFLVHNENITFLHYANCFQGLKARISRADNTHRHKHRRKFESQISIYYSLMLFCSSRSKHNTINRLLQYVIFLFSPLHYQNLLAKDKVVWSLHSSDGHCKKQRRSA